MSTNEKPNSKKESLIDVKEKDPKQKKSTKNFLQKTPFYH